MRALSALVLLLLGAVAVETSAASPAASPARPLSDAELARELRSIASSSGGRARLESLGRTRDGRRILRLEVGRGSADERSARPALLAVAGLGGPDPVGEAALLSWARRLVAGEGDRHGEVDEGGVGLLERASVHVVPRGSPDAVARSLERPQRHARRGPQPAVDDDHDGLLDEDPADDLDGDGLVTWMRVEDPAGAHVLDEKDARLMREADRSKGERPRWRLLPEGRDDDGDERWNEDEPGGVNLDRNFPFAYEWFATDAGVHQVSEPETRALADFVLEHPEIAVVFVFGDAENLAGQPEPKRGARGSKKSDDAGSGEDERSARWRRPEPPKSVHSDDLALLSHLGTQYREALGAAKELEAVGRPGTFADWCYFHRGRLALATRAWSPELQAVLETAEATGPNGETASGEGSDAEAEDDEHGPGADGDGGGAGAEGDEPEVEGSDLPGQESETGAAGEEDPAGAPEEDEEAEPTPEHAEAPAPDGEPESAGRPGAKRGRKGKQQDPLAADRELLEWLDEHAPAGFVAWSEVEHPDFPDRRVEIGGFAPFARLAPPQAELTELAGRHADFLDVVARSLPRVAVRRAEARHLGRGVHELEVEVENLGYLPTVLAHGETARTVRPTRVVLDVPAEAVLAGQREATLGPLAGSGGAETVRWIVRAPGRRRVTVEVISELGGRASAMLELEAGR